MGQLRVAVLQLAHLQHIVDQRQQMVGRDLHFPVVFPDKSHITKVGLVDLQQADDAVEGCADVAAHAVEEVYLCLVGPLGGLQRILQLLLLLFLLRDDLVNGAIERSHREDQKRFYSCHAFYSLDDFAKQLAVHNRRSNTLPMRSLRWLSPIEFAVQYV